MNELAISTSNILNSIEPALIKLSETFCVSVDYLKANAMEYILMYGRYELIGDILGQIFWALFIGIIPLVAYVGMLCVDEKYEDIIPYKKIVTFYILTSIICYIILIIKPLTQYIITPEIYSIKQILELIQGL